MKHYLMSVIAAVLSLPLCSSAEEPWYMTAGVGAIAVRGIKPSVAEQQVIETPGVVSSTTTKNKSMYKSVGLGRCLNGYFCLEAAYLWDAKFNTSLTIVTPNVGVVIIGGTPVNLNSLPASTTFRREADVSAIQLTAVGKMPITDSVEVFCRVGAYRYRLNLTAKLLLPGNLYLAEEAEETGTVPVASIGLDVKPFKKIGFRLEGTKAGKISMGSIAIVGSF